jgi:hypothetical protein
MMILRLVLRLMVSGHLGPLERRLVIQAMGKALIKVAGRTSFSRNRI